MSKDMEDFKKNWEKYETTPVRQFDLIIADILDVLNNESISEAKQYVRGLKDGNRFARKCPEINLIEQVLEKDKVND